VLKKLAKAPAVAAIIVFNIKSSFPAEANPFVKYLKK
jgi:hypothetical protein